MNDKSIDKHTTRRMAQQKQIAKIERAAAVTFIDTYNFELSICSFPFFFRFFRSPVLLFFWLMAGGAIFISAFRNRFEMMAENNNFVARNFSSMRQNVYFVHIHNNIYRICVICNCFSLFYITRAFVFGLLHRFASLFFIFRVWKYVNVEWTFFSFVIFVTYNVYVDVCLHVCYALAFQQWKCSTCML